MTIWVSSSSAFSALLSFCIITLSVELAPHLVLVLHQIYSSQTDKHINRKEPLESTCVSDSRFKLSINFTSKVEIFYSLLSRGDQEPAEVLHQSSMRKTAQIVGFLQLSLIQLTRPETPDTSTSHDTVAFSFLFFISFSFHHQSIRFRAKTAKSWLVGCQRSGFNSFFLPLFLSFHRFSFF